MLSRRSFVGSASLLLASIAARLASAEQDSKPSLDLNFLDRNASSEHARALGAPLRYVDHEVFGDPAGIMIEDAALNGVQDASYSSSGSLPAGWQLLPPPAAPKDWVATFTRIGEAQGRMRLQGNTAGDFYIVLGSSQHFPIATGEMLTGSVAIRLAAGSDKGNLQNLGLLIAENSADGTVANVARSVAPVQQIQTDKPWWAQVQTVAVQNGFANLAVKVTTSGQFDMTLEINHPQLEKRGWRSTFCAVSRQGDDILLAAPSDHLLHSERSVVITADAPRFVAAATLWSEYADAGNYIEVQLRDRVIYAKAVAGGFANEIRLGVVPPLMRFTVCLVIRAIGLTASLNGKPSQLINVAMPKGLTLVRLGGGTTGRWNSTIARLTLFKGAVFDGALESRRDQVFFDDFDRPDSSALGRSPTGQIIERTGNANTAIAGRKWVAIGGVLGGAAYGKLRLPNAPRYLGAVMTWTGGNAGGAAGLIAATNDDFTKPIDALHAVVSEHFEIFQTMSNSRVETALAVFAYPVAMRRDGQTPYGVACMLNSAESAVVFVGPQGDLARHVDPTYASRIGPIAVFEHYWQLAQCRPEFLAVAAS
jgi:hypothetical protein